MDELDRLHRRLLQNIRASFPDYLTRPFEVAELYTNLVPYRHNRRELELETIQDYEMALLRLLGGERGYLIGDPQMQADLREEAASPHPELSKFRAYATTMVSLAPDGAKSIDPPVIRRPGSGRQPGIAAITGERAAIADRPTLGAPSQSASAAPRPPSGPPPTPARPASMTPAAESAREPAIVADGCRYCGGELPDGRQLVFCPHCGQNLTVHNCPACGTELEVSWKFCITCGRAMA